MIFATSLFYLILFIYYKKVCESKDFWNIITPFQDTKILEFNQYQKSDEAPFVIYADLECLIERIDICKNNHKNPFTAKVSEHTASGFSNAYNVIS